MADNEIIAATLAAGMLPPLPPPAMAAGGGISEHEQARLVIAILHAVGLYRSILEGLAAKPQAASEVPNTGAGAAANDAGRAVHATAAASGSPDKPDPFLFLDKQSARGRG